MYGIGHLLLVVGGLQQARLLRVGDESGLHEDGGNVRRLQHNEGRLLYLAPVQLGDMVHLPEHIAAQARAGIHGMTHGHVV